MELQLISRQVMVALAGHGGPAILDETVSHLIRKSVIEVAPVGRRGLYPRSEVFIMRAALQLMQLGVVASHLQGVARALREILTAGEEYGAGDPDHEKIVPASVLSPSDQEVLDRILKRPQAGVGRTLEPDIAHEEARVRAWCAFERARLGRTDALILLWFELPEGPVEWQVRAGGEAIYGPVPTIAVPRRRAYLALDWGSVARGL